MSLFEKMEGFIGKEMTDASTIVASIDGDVFTYGIVVEFSSRFLIFKAEPDTDTISVHESRDLVEWLEGQSVSDALSLEPCDFLATFKGKLLTNVWQCQSGDNYTDAIDFGFGDLSFPNLKLFCITSELHVLSIAPA